MRFVLLSSLNRKKGGQKNGFHRYRLCGIMLLFMNQAMAGIVIYIVYKNKGFSYPGLLIYVMATYAFYCIIIAVVNVVRFQKHSSPVLSVVKFFNLVAALFSMLSLETAMLPNLAEMILLSVRL